MTWAPDYVTSTELKAFLRISDAVDDAQIALAITAASRAVDRHTNRQFGKVTASEARTYTARWDRDRCKYVVFIDDLADETGLTVVDDNGTAITDYTLKPTNADVKGMPWTHLVINSGGNCREDGITATTDMWGWGSVPVAVEQATMLQAERFFKRRDAPFGVAGSPDVGSELRLLAKVDPDVAVALGPYLRWWGAV
jgi:hypothetical protein